MAKPDGCTYPNCFICPLADCSWIGDCCLSLNRHFNVDFPMIKWSDDSPWLIEDLKQLEVVDSYEQRK